MKIKRPIMPCLCFSHADYDCALRWLRWASFLANQKGGDVSSHTLVVIGTRRISDGQWADLKDAVFASPSWFKVDWVVQKDELELGYPIAANHGFLRTLQYVSDNHPGYATLFIEPDAIPVSSDWFSSILSEYNSHDKCFSGMQVESNMPHSTGNAVYGPDWADKAPLILTVLDRKNSGGMFADGRGFPFDLTIGCQVLENYHPSKRIYQIWSPGIWTTDMVARLVPSGVKLLHQSKDGSLIYCIAEMRYPEYIKTIPKPTTHFLLHSSTSQLKHGSQVFEFHPCARSVGGCLWSVYEPKNPIEESTLCSLAGRFGVERITRSDFSSLMDQSKRLNP